MKFRGWRRLLCNGRQCLNLTSLEERNHQTIKKLTQHLKHLLLPKKHASTGRHGRIKINGWGLTERKTKCCASFVQNSLTGKSWNTPQCSNSLEKSLNFRGSPWKVLEFQAKVLKFLCKSLKNPWIFVNFKCTYVVTLPKTEYKS